MAEPPRSPVHRTGAQHRSGDERIRAVREPSGPKHPGGVEGGAADRRGAEQVSTRACRRHPQRLVLALGYLRHRLTDQCSGGTHAERDRSCRRSDDRGVRGVETSADQPGPEQVEPGREPLMLRRTWHQTGQEGIEHRHRLEDRGGVTERIEPAADPLDGSTCLGAHETGGRGSIDRHGRGRSRVHIMDVDPATSRSRRGPPTCVNPAPASVDEHQAATRIGCR